MALADTSKRKNPRRNTESVSVNPNPRDFALYGTYMTYPVQLPTSENSALWSSVPPARMSTFLRETPNGTADEALSLYLWDRNLATAFLADLAIVEVVLRDALHRAATNEWGVHWYEEMPLDSRSEKSLKDAWSRLPKQLQRNPYRSDIPGRLVANCMFGFWTNLLDQGGYTGLGPRRRRISYDDNWQALRKAFPGGRREADRQRRNSPTHSDEITFSRAWVFQVCKRVNDIRNRVAHHEPVLNGFPLKGQSSNGAGRRLSPLEAHEEILSLSRMVDRGMASWLQRNSKVPQMWADRPALKP